MVKMKAQRLSNERSNKPIQLPFHCKSLRTPSENLKTKFFAKAYFAVQIKVKEMRNGEEVDEKITKPKT